MVDRQVSQDCRRTNGGSSEVAGQESSLVETSMKAEGFPVALREQNRVQKKIQCQYELVEVMSVCVEKHLRSGTPLNLCPTWTNLHLPTTSSTQIPNLNPRIFHNHRHCKKSPVPVTCRKVLLAFVTLPSKATKIGTGQSGCVV